MTAKEAAVGLAIAVVLGVLLGALMSQAKWIERSFYPWAIVLQTVPILAIVPLLDLWAKNDILFVEEGFRSRIIVCVIISLFPIISNTVFGLLAGDASHHDLFSVNRASRWTRFRKLELPGAMPAMFVGFRIAAGLCVVGAIIGEYFFRVGEQGLGQLLDKYTKRGTSDYPQLYATIAVSCAFGDRHVHGLRLARPPRHALACLQRAGDGLSRQPTMADAHRPGEELEGAVPIRAQRVPRQRQVDAGGHPSPQPCGDLVDRPGGGERVEHLVGDERRPGRNAGRADGLPHGGHVLRIGA